MTEMRIPLHCAWVWAVLAWIPLSGGGAIAQQVIRYQGLPNVSSVRIDGTSTVHDWTVKGKLIAGYMQVNGEFPSDLSVTAVPALKTPPVVAVMIPVRSLKSGQSTMDNVMHRAMKQKEHPRITYALKEMKPSEEKRKGGESLKYDTVGKLTVSGVSKMIHMLVTLKPRDDGGLEITGKTKVRMTEFGIKPPAPKIALGLIRTGDEVEITFKWVTRKRVMEKK